MSFLKLLDLKQDNALFSLEKVSLQGAAKMREIHSATVQKLLLQISALCRVLQHARSLLSYLKIVYCRLTSAHCAVFAAVLSRSGML